MKYRNFGKSKKDYSVIGFGAWAIGGDMWGPQDDNESLKALHKAVDLGLNFIDTAQGYGKGHSEEIIGKFLKNRKEEIFVATKVPPVPGTTWPPPDDYDPRQAFPAKYIIEECDKSLRRLQRDTIDVYQFHTWATIFNIFDEWFEAMVRLREQGKIRMIGVSVPDTKPDSVVGSLVEARVDSVQVIFNLFEQYPAWNLFPVCQKHDIAVIVRVPFDEGALTGKFTKDTIFVEGDVRKHYFRGKNLPAVVDRVEEIKKYKDEHCPEASMPEFALQFCTSHPAVSTVIPGIRNVHQAVVNCKAGDAAILSEKELKNLRRFAWRKDFWSEEVEA